jgi:hypothetical protein
MSWKPSDVWSPMAAVIAGTVSSLIPTSGGPSSLDDGRGELAPEPPADECGADVEALHLAGTAVERPERHASGHDTVDPREQELSQRWSVGAGKSGKLFVEALEAEAEAERCAVLDEEGADLADVGVGRGVPDEDGGHRGGW